jgi:hypothetical protein
MEYATEIFIAITVIGYILYLIPNGDNCHLVGHKWQTRGVNRYGLETYRVCTKCNRAEGRVNESYEPDKFEQCEHEPNLDAQFDENNQYIFKK